MEVHVRKFSKLDEFEDIDEYFFDTVLSLGPMHELKGRLKTL